MFSNNGYDAWNLYKPRHKLESSIPVSTLDIDWKLIKSKLSFWRLMLKVGKNLFYMRKDFL
jgi:hypothetical protein